MATFEDVQKYLVQREALNKTMLDLRIQLVMVRNAAAVNETLLRPNSAQVKGWRIYASDAKKSGGDAHAAGVSSAAK